MADSTIKRCSFCDRPRNEVKALISGGPPGAEVHICNRCLGDGWKAFESEQKKTSAAKEKEAPLPKPVEIKAGLDEWVIAQDKAKVDVAIAVYNHYRRREAARMGIELGDVVIQKSNVLLMGPSGVGKTEIARCIARQLNVPFHVGDATRLTQAGYVGDDIESLIQGLISAAGGDLERAAWGIIFLDEADKLARKSGRSGGGYRDVGGEGVQQSILKMLEGAEMAIPRGVGMRSGMTSAVDTIDTTNILFVFAGSFAGIEEIIERRVNKRSHLGFGSEEKKALSKTDIYLSVTEDDVLEFGLIPELLGRLPVLTTCIELTEAEMVRILTEPKSALIKQFIALFKLDGIDLQFDEAALSAIAREAKKRPTGARALRSIVEDILRPYSFESRSEPNIKAIRITEDVVNKKDGATAMIVRKEPKKKADPPPAVAQG
jgi:ATP-dependent Clp protease ATP-binding subunit ClpX